MISTVIVGFLACLAFSYFKADAMFPDRDRVKLGRDNFMFKVRYYFYRTIGGLDNLDASRRARSLMNFWVLVFITAPFLPVYVILKIGALTVVGILKIFGKEL